MIKWDRYLNPSSLDEALRYLEEAAGSARLIAGGTDLLIDLQQERDSPICSLVDISCLPDPCTLEMRGQELFVGAAVPLSRVASSSLVRLHAEALAEACDGIGSPQVRAVATLGGNVAHGLPAADGAIALVALEAKAEIAWLGGRRRAALPDLYLGPGQTALGPDKDILVGFYLPIRKEGQASAFGRVGNPQGVALAVVNSAVWLEVDLDTITDVRIALGPGGPIPRRALPLEEALRGRAFSLDTFDRMGEVLRESVRFRSSARRASAGYRYSVAEQLLVDLLSKAWRRMCRERHELP